MSRPQFFMVATLIFAAAAMPREMAAICSGVALAIGCFLVWRGER